MSPQSRRPATPSRPTVAIVAPSLEIMGGQGVEAAWLQERLHADGYPVSLVPINPRLPAGLRWLRRIPIVRTMATELRYLPSLARLARADVAHVFSASYWSFLLAPVPAMLAARAMGRRVVLHYHSGEAQDHLDHWGVLVHPWLRLAHEIVVPSEYLRGIFERHGHAATVIVNVVDRSAFAFRERSRLSPRLLSVRNLEAHYGVDTVIRAFAHVRARRPDATLTIAGAGRERTALERLVDELGVRGVRFLGRVERDAMPRLYADADVLVNASVIDNQPVSLLEAWSSGVPVVTTPTGAIGEMVDGGRTGVIVPPGDDTAMADAVGRLLDNPSMALALAREGRLEAERYDWPCVRDAWAQVYAGGRTPPDTGTVVSFVAARRRRPL